MNLANVDKCVDLLNAAKEFRKGGPVELSAPLLEFRIDGPIPDNGRTIVGTIVE